jgi:hypothetical protein
MHAFLLTSDNTIRCNADAEYRGCEQQQQPGGGASHVDDASFLDV